MTNITQAYICRHGCINYLSYTFNCITNIDKSQPVIRVKIFGVFVLGVCPRGFCPGGFCPGTLNYKIENFQLFIRVKMLYNLSGHEKNQGINQTPSKEY